MMLGTLSFLVTTPEAWQEGRGIPQLSVLGEALLKDSVLLGASLMTAAESLRAARGGGHQASAPEYSPNGPGEVPEQRYE